MSNRVTVCKPTEELDRLRMWTDDAAAELTRLRADDAEMVERVRKAVSPQISEGLGAVLRKFCDSDHAAKARFHLHAMPDSDWKTLIDMLSSEAARAALSAMRGEP